MIDKKFWNGKKVFVTGHTGFKGAWLCKLLLVLGAEVTGYALEPPTNPNLFNIASLRNEKNINTIIGDVRDLDLLKKSLLESKAEIVIHMAAQPIVRTSYKIPIETYEINVMGVVNTLEAVRFCPTVKSVVNVTTDKVYLNRERAEGYREDEYLCGYDPYSNSKSCSELVTYSYRKSFFQYDNAPAISTARSGNVVGGGDFAADRIIPDCCRAVTSGETIIVRNPYSIRPYQHVLDCLKGYLLLAELQYGDKDQYEGEYNFGPDDSDCVSTGELVSLFCDQWNSRDVRNSALWQDKSEEGPLEANFLKLNCSKAKEILDWLPTWGITEAMEEIVEWLDAYNKKLDINEYMRRTIGGYLG